MKKNLICGNFFFILLQMVLIQQRQQKGLENQTKNPAILTR